MEDKTYLLSSDQILSLFKTKLSGLSDEEAKTRLEKYGPNQITVKNQISPFLLYLQQFKNTLTLILIVSAMLILFIYYFGGREKSNLIEAGLILSIVILITALGFIQEFKAEKAIESLKKLLAFKAKVIRGNSEKEIDVSALVQGDIVILEEGLKVPADIRLLRTFSLSVGEAALTGESVSVEKQTDQLKESKQIADQKNMVFSGTSIESGRGLGVVVRTGDNTEIGKIARDVAQIKDDQTPIQKRLDAIGKSIGIGIVIICAVVFFFIMFFASEFMNQPLLYRIIHSFIAAVALAVAAIPEGLPAVVTISLAFGTQRMLKKNALVRRLSSVETLGSTDVICSDKTGTLTKGEMTVTKIFFDGNFYAVSGTGYDTNGSFSLGKEMLKEIDFPKLTDVWLNCNNSTLLENRKILGDPTEAALLVCAKKAGQSKVSKERRIELPFTSSRKRMTVVIEDKDTFHVYMKGGAEIVLDHCTHLYKAAQNIPLSSDDKDNLLKINEDLSRQALRNLGFAYKTLSKSEFQEQVNDEAKLENGLVFLGITGMIDPPRPEVKELIQQCRDSGIRVIMITGDHAVTAGAVARDIGIGGDVLTGDDLDRLNEEDFSKRVESISVYARVNPGTKMRIIGALKNKGHIVAMTGDGVNDAPALKKADIGIAMGITGSDVAKEASDMVLLDDKFSTIISAIEEGRGIFHNIRKFVVYLLSCNIAEVLVIFTGVMLLHSLPLSATMLLWVNVVTDGIPAIALGFDPAEKGIMRHSPKVFQAEIINRRIKIEMFIFSTLLAAQILVLYTLNLSSGQQAASGAAFIGIVFFELVNLYSVRSGYRISFASNKWLFISLLITISLQLFILTNSFLRGLFDIKQIDLYDWMYIIGASLWLLLIFRLVRVLLDKHFKPKSV
jgi:Ca2+-transporting ATPase